MAAVEAMASGLPVLLSDVITRELAFGSAVTYLPLAEPEQWIHAAKQWTEDTARVRRQTEPAENGLDIRTNTRLLERIYLGC